jgi:hypothetical protein
VSGFSYLYDVFVFHIFILNAIQVIRKEKGRRNVLKVMHQEVYQIRKISSKSTNIGTQDMCRY